MRAWALLALLAPTTGASCVEVRYQVRDPRIGDPAQPPMQIEGLSVRDLHGVPGEEDQGNDWARPKMTASGMEYRDAPDDFERTVLWKVRIQGGARTEITGLTWSPESAPRCAGGHQALDILVDDVEHNSALLAPDVQVHWERPVVISGEQVVAGRFHEDPPLLHAPSVVDVLVVHRDGDRTTEECVRVPATGPGITYWNKKRWSFGGRIFWRRSLPSTSSSLFGVAASFGRWVGPVRIGIEGTVGGTSDSKPDSEAPSGTGWCFIDPGTDCDIATFGGGSLEASGIGWRWNRWALGWSVAFESIYARIKHTPPGGTQVARSAVSLGPRLGLSVLRAAPDVAGVSRISPTSAWGFEVFVAAGTTVSGEGAGDPITGGIALIGF